MSKKQKDINVRQDFAYKLGISDYNAGKETNPWGVADLLERCSWAAGYWDRHRGMV